MWRIKRRRTKPKENKAKTGVIYPKLNATVRPNRYVNRNTYLDVKCNKELGAGCTDIGCQNTIIEKNSAFPCPTPSNGFDMTSGFFTNQAFQLYGYWPGSTSSSVPAFGNITGGTLNGTVLDISRVTFDTINYALLFGLGSGGASKNLFTSITFFECETSSVRTYTSVQASWQAGGSMGGGEWTWQTGTPTSHYTQAEEIAYWNSVRDKTLKVVFDDPNAFSNVCNCTFHVLSSTSCKTAPYRNPILGYRKHLIDCSGNSDLSGCGYTKDVSGNVYKDNYAKTCATHPHACYNQVIRPKQNKNGCVDESYNYSTNQYLTRRCMTYKQQEFNFLSQVPVDASDCCTKFMVCPNCQFTTEKPATSIIVAPASADSPSSPNTLIYTLDGESWIGLGKEIFTNYATVVKNNGSIWVAGGNASTDFHGLAYSSNGKEWNSATVNTTDSIEFVYDIAYNSFGQWMAVVKIASSSYIKIFKSSNGMTWEQDNRTFSGNPYLETTDISVNAIAYGVVDSTRVLSQSSFPFASNKNWQGITSSADGTKLVAIVAGEQVNSPTTEAQRGSIWISSDSGNHWDQVDYHQFDEPNWTPAHFWSGITSSADGTKLAVTEENHGNLWVYSGRIWISSDSGVTWSQAEVASQQSFTAITSSATGKYLAACCSDGMIYSSNDYGENWTTNNSPLPGEISNAGGWSSITSSAGDSVSWIVAATVNFSNNIYISNNAGSTFTAHVFSPGLTGLQMVTSITASADGVNMAVSVYDGYIWTSNNSGTNWTKLTSAGKKYWNNITSSADGTRLAANEYFGPTLPAGQPGNIWTSNDSGTNWTKLTSAGTQYWNSITSSADGTKLGAVSAYSPWVPDSSGQLCIFTQNVEASKNPGWIIFGKCGTNCKNNIFTIWQDSTQWSQSTTPFTGQVSNGVYDGSKWVIVGEIQGGGSALAWSENGTTNWQWVTTAGTFGGFNGVGKDVFYNGKKWIAVGTKGSINTTIAASDDGKIWTSVFLHFGMRRIFYAPIIQRWIAVTNNLSPTFYYSEDGITWIPHPTTPGLLPASSANIGFMDSGIITESVAANQCTCSKTGFCTGINKLPCEVKNTKCFAIYKRSNSKFNRQGAVSGGSRINRLKYQTRMKAQGRIVNGKRNIINRRGPAANYNTSKPLTLRDDTYCVNPPPGPTSLFATESHGIDDTIFLNWKNPDISKLCRIAPITGFTIQRTGSSFGHTVNLPVVYSYDYTGLSPGIYNIRLRTNSYYGSSDWVYLYNIAVVNPAKITDLTGQHGDTTVTLSWTKPHDGGFPITNYEYSIDNGNYIHTNSTQTSCTITSLTNGQQYSFTVKPINGYPNVASNMVYVTPSTIPDAPTLSDPIHGNKFVNLTWTDPSNGGNAISEYVIYITPTGYPTYSRHTNIPVTSYTVTGLTNGTSYTFTVKAKNINGLSLPSNSKSAIPSTVPDAPTNLTGTPGDQQVDLSWTAPGNTGGSSILDYEYSIDSGAYISIGMNTSHQVTGLTNGTSYTFNVKAKNINGSSEPATITEKPGTLPDPPTDLTVTYGDQQLNLSWTAPVNTGGSAITKYYMYTDATSHDLRVQVNAPTTNGSFNGLTNGQSYDVAVKAWNEIGESINSNIVTETPSTIPDAPTDLSGTAGDTQVDLDWNFSDATSGGAPPLSWNVYVHPPLPTNPIFSLAPPIVTVTGLTNGIPYTFYVTQTNINGESPQSSSIQVTPTGVPDAPTNLTGTPGDQQVDLSWTAPENTGGVAISYYEYSINSGVYISTPNANLIHTVTGLTNGTSYTFKVRAINTNGPSPPSASASAIPSVSQ